MYHLMLLHYVMDKLLLAMFSLRINTTSNKKNFEEIHSYKSKLPLPCIEVTLYPNKK